MQRYESGLQLNKKQADFLFYLSLIMAAMFVFLFLGGPGYYVIDDSLTYMDITSDMVEGVMPVYPFFLLINRLIFGEERYLYAVVIEQSVFAAFCVTCFIRFIKNHLQLSYLEAYICFILALLPFAADLPETVIPREILTEGIAYAAFYLFCIALLKTVWNKSWKPYALLCAVALLMSSIRSQMQILFGVCGVVCIYIVVFGGKNKSRRQIPVRLLIGVIGALAIGLIGIRATSQIARGYNWTAVRMKDKLAERQAEEVETEDADAGTGNFGEPVEETTETESVSEKTDAPNRTLIPVYAASQYVSLIFNKGMYEADYEDYQLFEDEYLQNVYLDLYAKIDVEHCRYVYAQPGLWMWRDIAGGSGRIGTICLGTLPEERIEIGLTLIKAHWARFLYHTIMLMPQAFVSTVFFQIERIYLLCHLITLFLYISAIALMIWAYVDKRVEKTYAELMGVVLVVNCILVAVISAVFFGQKRYLFYNFGIFYIAYFLLLLQLWKQYGRTFVVERLEKFRKTEAGKTESIERQCHGE